MSEKYEVTKEAILAMAEKSPDAKEVLKVGFPKAFEEKHFDLVALKGNHTLFTNEEAKRAGFKDNCFMQIRGVGQYARRAFLLDEYYLKWDLRRDCNENLQLTVERK